MDEFLDRKTRPELVGFGDMKIPEIRTVTTVSGCQLYVLPNDGADVVRLYSVWPRGLYNSGNLEAQILLPTLLEDGTENSDGDKITGTLDFNGATVTGFSNTYATHLCLTSISKNFSSLLPLFEDMILNPTFPEDSLKRKANALKTQVEVGMTSLSYIAAKESASQVWGKNHPVSRSIDPENLGSLKRTDIVAAHNKLCSCRPDFWIAGNIDESIISETKKMIDSYAGKTDFSVFNQEFYPLEAQPASTKVVEVIGKGQSCIVATLPTIGFNHPDYYALMIAVTHLGGYFNSRLNMNIREEKGLTYGVQAMVSTSAEGSFITIRCQTRSGNEELVIGEIKKEMLGLATEKPTDQEMKSVTNSIEGSLASSLDSVFTTVSMLITNKYNGLPVSDFDRRLMVARNISAEEISAIAEKYLSPENLSITIAKGVQE